MTPKSGAAFRVEAMGQKLLGLDYWPGADFFPLAAA